MTDAEVNSFKNKFTEDSKYLAVINENGLWIKDEINDSINIINADKIKKEGNDAIKQMEKNLNKLSEKSAGLQLELLENIANKKLAIQDLDATQLQSLAEIAGLAVRE